MELRPINKKGQGLTSSTLILLVVGVIVMVIVVLGFTKGWNFFTDLFNTGSIDMEAISQKCGLLASTGGGGYCTDRIEIGKDKYINCKHAETLGITSTGNACSEASKQICEKLKLEGDNFDGSKVEVNGEACDKAAAEKAAAEKVAAEKVAAEKVAAEKVAAEKAAALPGTETA